MLARAPRLRVLVSNFVQGNDQKHASKLCKGYLQHLEGDGLIKVREWPPQSLDLNTIELLWHELDLEVKKAVPTSEADS
ncbi:hypothetical protein Trydic_g12846 [Trypoxylus dichotomus]